MPRVIAGKCKGIPLLTPKGETTRPTTDKVKEALFSIIMMRIPNSQFLDLFSGSGQMGIEAVSRGAKSACLVDENTGSALAIIENIRKTHLEEQICFYKRDVFGMIRQLGEEKRQFDIIYMDPPYVLSKKYSEKIAKVVCEYDLLSEDGIMIVEHAQEDVLPENVTNLTFNRRCKYGSTVLTFYTRC